MTTERPVPENRAESGASLGNDHAHLPAARPRCNPRLRARGGFAGRSCGPEALLFLALAWACLCAPSAPAGLVRTLDHRQYEGDITLAGDALRIAVSGADAVHVPLAELQQAVFSSSSADPPSLGELRGGWMSRDVGDVSVAGRSGQSNDLFAIRVAASDAEDSGDGFHFIHQQTSGDAEIIARLISITGPDRLARASLTMRESLSAGCPFALVGVRADGQLCFQSRVAWGKKARTQNLEPVGIVHWLRLVKKGLRLSAYHSRNGRDWLPAGVTNTTLSGNLYVGMTLSTHGSFDVAQAQFDRVRLMVNGLRGEYFADRGFQRLGLARVDPRPEFSWGQAPPADSFPAGPFSVRWTGQLEAPSSGDWTFHLETDGTARCWVRDQLAAQAGPGAAKGEPVSLRLQADQRYDVRLEYERGEGEGALRLAWLSPSQKRETIPQARLFCVPDITTATNPVLRSPTTVSMGAAKGVLLCNSSFVAGQVKSVTESSVKLALQGEREISLPTHKVAVVFIHVPKRPFLPEPGRAGVLLNNGDFFEGDFRRIEGGSVKVSSVLFGVRTFWLNEVVAIYLAAAIPGPAQFEVRTLEGSLLRAASLRSVSEALTVEEPVIGPVRLPLNSLLEIRRPAP